MSLADVLSTPGRRFAAFAAAITIIRIATLVFGEPNLGPDEAQYWFWAKSPAFGYFSKPPLIAWAIAATTSVFGDAEWAVRLSSPLFQLGAGVFLFFLGRRLFSPAVGFWAGVAWLTMPGVSLSSALMTTDAPLLFFWSAALYFFFRLAEARPMSRDALREAALLGAAIGLGALSKYAMLYFPIGAALAVALSPALRRPSLFAPIAVSFAVAALLMAPNILWNADNEFRTIAHTAANANLGGERFGGLSSLLKYVGDQVGVAGPILLILILVAAWDATRRRDGRALSLAAFAVPPLVIIAVQAVLSRAHGNWAAVAYPSAIILASAYAMTGWRALAARASIAIHLVAATVFSAAFVSAAFADSVGLSRAFKRLRGWEVQGPAVVAAAAGFDAILADDREVMSGLVYYARGGPRIAALDSNRSIDHHYEAFVAFDPARDRRALLVTTRADAATAAGRFSTIRRVGETRVDLKGDRSRTLYLFELADYRGD